MSVSESLECRVVIYLGFLLSFFLLNRSALLNACDFERVKKRIIIFVQTATKNRMYYVGFKNNYSSDFFCSIQHTQKKVEKHENRDWLCSSTAINMSLRFQQKVLKIEHKKIPLWSFFLTKKKMYGIIMIKPSIFFLVKFVFNSNFLLFEYCFRSSISEFNIKGFNSKIEFI